MSRQGQGHDRTPEDFRAYLQLLARLQPEPGLRGKIDLSGVVQQTVLEAYQALEQFQQLNEDQQRAWLRRALAHNLTDEVRKLRTAKRDVGRERSLEAALEESSARLDAWLTIRNFPGSTRPSFILTPSPRSNSSVLGKVAISPFHGVISCEEIRSKN